MKNNDMKNISKKKNINDMKNINKMTNVNNMKNNNNVNYIDYEKNTDNKHDMSEKSIEKADRMDKENNKHNKHGNSHSASDVGGLDEVDKIERMDNFAKNATLKQTSLTPPLKSPTKKFFVRFATVAALTVAGATLLTCGLGLCMVADVSPLPTATQAEEHLQNGCINISSLQNLCGTEQNSALDEIIRLPSKKNGQPIQINVNFPASGQQKQTITEAVEEFNQIFSVINSNYHFELNFSPSFLEKLCPNSITFEVADNLTHDGKKILGLQSKQLVLPSSQGKVSFFNKIKISTEIANGQPQHFKSVLQHELGHVFGLPDVYVNAGCSLSIMQQGGGSVVMGLNVEMLDSLYRNPQQNLGNPQNQQSNNIADFVQNYDKNSLWYKQIEQGLENHPTPNTETLQHALFTSVVSTQPLLNKNSKVEEIDQNELSFLIGSGNSKQLFQLENGILTETTFSQLNGQAQSAQFVYPCQKIGGKLVYAYGDLTDLKCFFHVFKCENLVFQQLINLSKNTSVVNFSGFEIDKQTALQTKEQMFQKPQNLANGQSFAQKKLQSWENWQIFAEKEAQNLENLQIFEQNKQKIQLPNVAQLAPHLNLEKERKQLFKTGKSKTV